MKQNNKMGFTPPPRRITPVKACKTILTATVMCCIATTITAQTTNTFTPNGNVGIGTTAPSVPLEINKTLSVGATAFKFGNAQQNNQILFKDRAASTFLYGIQSNQLNVGVTGADHQINSLQSNANNLTFWPTFAVNSSSNILINPTGNVGINKTAPAYKLDVNGSINATQFLINGSPFSASNPFWLASTTNSNNIYYNTGNVGIGTNAPTVPLQIGTTLTQGATVFNFGNPQQYNQVIFRDRDKASFLYGAELGQVKIGLSGTDHKIMSTQANSQNIELYPTVAVNSPSNILINAGQNVGIGTANPTYKLDINGSQRLNGAFANTAWVGTANRLLKTDASGNITPFANGTAGQYLDGTGAWLNLPSALSSFSTTGNKIYIAPTMSLGIGTANPQYPLDVAGDARIQNNLYVGGGIVITDRLNAAESITTVAMQADSILLDATRGVYGTTNLNGDVNIAINRTLTTNGDIMANSKLTVNGGAKFNGTLTASQGIDFGNGFTFKTRVSTTAGVGNIITLGSPPPVGGGGGNSGDDPPSCSIGSGVTGWLNNQSNGYYATQTSGANTSWFTQYVDGVNGNSYLDASGGLGNAAELRINEKCLNNTFINSLGGIVNLGTTRCANLLTVGSSASTAGSGNINILNGGTGNAVAVYMPPGGSATGSAYVVTDNTNTYFKVSGNGRTQIITNATTDAFSVADASTNQVTFKINKIGETQIKTNSTADAFSIADATTNQVNFKINKNGRTAIGSNTPAEDLLHIGISAGKIILGSLPSSGSLGFGTSYIGFNTSRQSATNWTTAGDGSHNGAGTIYGDVNGNMYFAAFSSTGPSAQTNISDVNVAAKALLTIKPAGTGQVVIGNQTQTTGPHTNALLTVNGKMVAKSCYIKVIDWADYVFAKDYKLPNLYDVEKYYLANKHLPEIPSEKEVLENGIDVAEMNKLLLKKIEEMTILMVKQQKQIDALEVKVK